ncbi:MAG: polysaccharide biosynthesis tyrosine autokinase [Oxalobacteraceae bacterium]|jgi:tyrosine-protein kinase Etk/Wzc|nr:polysaccharide biosynthesis tyrosine autokinase [Oxalobacteraceae bacterium]
MNSQLSTHVMPTTEVNTSYAKDNDESLASYLDLIIQQRYFIGFVALIIILSGVLYAYMANPQYEANLLVQVEEKGQREPKNILGEAGSIIDYKTPSSAEIELLRSRLVIARAIDKLKLYIDAKPRRLPLVGDLVSRMGIVEYFPTLQQTSKYAWGKESMSVNEFSVPTVYESRSFRLVNLDGKNYQLSESQSGIRQQGIVGQTLKIPTPDGEITLLVDEIQATPGIEFSLARNSRLAIIEAVQNSLTVSELGKQSGIISATLKGNDADIIYRLLTEIGQQYMALNSTRRTEEADKSLAYLNRRLPELRQQLEQSEARYNQFRNTHGTVDIGEEGRLSLQRSAAARTRRIELEQKRGELLTRYTSNHPSVIAVDEQLAEVNRELREAASHLKNLPLIEQEMVRLARDVKVNSELYSALLSSSQQLQLISIGKTSNVHLVDTPEKPDRPVTPNRPRIIAVSIFLGIALGVFAAFIRRSLQTVLIEPAQAEKLFGVPVYASIPHSKEQQQLTAQTSELKQLPVLARIASTDPAIESLRNFRSALQFCLSQSRNNTVLITGPTEGLGKSFVSVNLACIVAASGKRVLLIDGDLRDGHLHRYFNRARTKGLADILTGTESRSCVAVNVIENLDFLSTGHLPPNPSEMLLRPELAQCLSGFSASYDMILIDAAPLLLVADSLIIGAHAGSIFLTTRSGVTRPGDIAESLKRLARAGLTPKGLLFNDIMPRSGHYSYHYGSYGARKQITYSPKSDPSSQAIA